MIWEPFVLALVLGIIISAGLYFAYLWPSVEPLDEEPPATAGPADRGDDPGDSVVSDAPAPPSTAQPTASPTTAQPASPPVSAQAAQPGTAPLSPTSPASEHAASTP